MAWPSNEMVEKVVLLTELPLTADEAGCMALWVGLENRASSASGADLDGA